jgi:hypothetical protein
MTSKVAPIQEELEEEASPPFCNLYNALSSVLFACSGSSSDYFPCCKPFSNSTSVSVPESSTVAEHDSGKKTSTFIAKASSPPSKDTNKCISEQESDFSITPHKVPVTRNHVHVEEIAKHQVCSSSNRSTAKSQGNTSHSKSTPTASLQQIPFTVNQNGNEYNGASTSIGLSPTDFSHVYANFRPSTPMLAYSTPTNCEETTAMSTPNTIPFFFQQQNINNTINVCSEPIASIYKVRGPTYFQNGIKLPSQESILALVRVESYVVVNPTKPYPSKNNDTRKDNDHSSKNFLCLWKQQLDPHHPFLLIVNWILPWGSLKSYFCQMNDCHNKSNPAHQLWNRFATQMTNVSRVDQQKKIEYIPARYDDKVLFIVTLSSITIYYIPIFVVVVVVVVVFIRNRKNVTIA